MAQSVSRDCMKPKPCFSFSKPPLPLAPAFAEPLSVHASRRIQTGFPSRLCQPCLVSSPCIILCSLVYSDLIMCTSSAKCTVMQLRRLTHKLRVSATLVIAPQALRLEDKLLFMLLFFFFFYKVD